MEKKYIDSLLVFYFTFIRDMKPQTISELEDWMNSNCYNDSYAIGSRSIYEGFGLKRNGDLFIWYFTERGREDELKTFNSEADAVEYAFNQIRADKYAHRHLLAMVKTASELAAITSELKTRSIEFETDEIPYGGLSDMRIRIFVSGCDILKSADLKTGI